ncbi:MAG: energy-coupling factor transporter ATPase [Oscillospiraceae bacterium]
MNELVNVQDLSFEYDGENEVPVLHKISTTIKEGEFIAVLGHNGSGKSTFAKHLNAILKPSNGVVYIDGIDTSKDEMLFEIRKKVGMVFQNPDNQIVATIVEEDVAFGLENLGVEPKEIRQRVDDSLKAVGMSEYSRHAPHNLSGGQKQRVAIAGIIAMNPKCIVLDEPTAMLDPKGRKEVLNTITKLNKSQNTTVVYITHFMDEAIKADRVIVIDNGKILIDGTPKEVFCNVEMLKSIGLDVPQVTELTYELQKEGFNLPSDILTVDDFINSIGKEIKSGNN